MGRLLVEHDAGWVVPPGDPAALAVALEEVLDRPDRVAARRANAAPLLAAFTWERALEGLVAFCRDPRKDPTRDDFAFRPATVSPPDSWTFRLRRRIARLLGTRS